MAELLKRFETTNGRTVSKYRDSLGRNQYRAERSNGPISKKQYAGLKAHEKDDEEEDEDEPPEPPRVRVTATYKRETRTKGDSPAVSTPPNYNATAKVEFSGVFGPGEVPTRSDVINKMSSILNEWGVGGFAAKSTAKLGTNVSMDRTFEPRTRGWEGENVTLETESDHESKYRAEYNLDAEQERLTRDY